MIGPLHADIWGIIVRAGSDATTTALAGTHPRLRRIVYDHYVDLIGPAYDGRRHFAYEYHNCSVRETHQHWFYDMEIVGVILESSYDLHEFGLCDDDHYISTANVTLPPFSAAIVKIAAGMTELNTRWKIVWPESQN